MGKNLESKCKQCRRVGEKLMLKGDRCSSPSCAMVRRNYTPGFHGPKQGPSASRRRSDYGVQLNEKQKLKKQYGLLEKQFKISFRQAQKKAGNAGENLVVLLEGRLDNVVYRLGFASSRGQARQLVNHGHFTVNKRKVNIPSYQIKEKDVIQVNHKNKKVKIFSNLEEKLKNFEAPGWLHLNIKDLSAKVLHLPLIKEINNNVNVQMIVEYYSR